MASNIPSTSAQPYSSSTFSFTAPYPPSSTSTSQSQTKPQRRVSLALPSSPRVFPAWSFRDDTGLGGHSNDTDMDDADADVLEKRGKMRRIVPDDPGEEPLFPSSDKPEKKPRKKWTMEETQMLVAGCNKVRHDLFCSAGRELTTNVGVLDSGASGIGSPSSTTPTSSLTAARP